MADANFEAQRMAELMAQVNYELERLGHVTKQTHEEIADAQMKAKYGVENFTKGTAKGAEAITALAGAAGAAGKAMLDGKKGAAAFNESVDGMATAVTAAAAALALFVPVLGPLMLAIGAATIGFAKYTKAANDQADQLYKGYQGLAKSGAAASDGMTGLFQNAKKLGLSMNELDSLVSLVGENSRDLAAFGGSVAEGTKRFADMGAAMEPHRVALIRMGMLPEQINEGMAGYLRTQTRLGNAQKMTVDQLATGAREYLKEQDALTKLTGQTRQETEKKREAALIEEQFASKIRSLQLANRHEEAERLIAMNDLASAVNEEMGRGIRAASTGNLVNEDARKLFMSAPGALRDIQQVIGGTKNVVDGVKSISQQISDTNDKQAVQLGLANAANKTYISVGSAAQIRTAALEEDLAKRKAKIDEDNLKRDAGKGDKVLEGAAKLRDTQINANKNMEEFINAGIPAAQAGMQAIAEASLAAAKALNRLAGSDDDKNVEARRKAVEDAKIGGMMSDTMLNDMGMDFGNLSGADGGVFKGPASGYPVLMHGTEAIIPMDKLSGAMKLGGLDLFGKSKDAQTGAGNKAQDQNNTDADKMEKFVQEMLKDTETLTKITDKDLKKQQRYSITANRLIDLKMDLMADEIDLLEEQNSMLTEMENTLKQSMGEDQVKETMRAFKMSRMGNLSAAGFGSPASGGGGGGVVAPMPAGGSAGSSSSAAPASPVSSKGGGGGSNVVSGSGQPIMTGAGVPLTYGGAATKQDLQDLFDFGSASGSKSNFEQLEDGFKNAVIKAAEEYNATTGKKLRVNSAKRDSADQERLYNDYLARGKTGMPVGRPGMSRHERGMAIDIQNYGDSQAIAAMNRQGLYQKVPNDPVHFQFAKGGISTGPRSGYLATLHGPEAVVPLPDGKSIPVKMSGNQDSNSMMGSVGSDLGNMMGQLKDVLYMLSDKMNNPQMLVLMDEMVRAQKNSNDIQNKMLKAQA
jgi:hypothetical protein